MSHGTAKATNNLARIGSLEQHNQNPVSEFGESLVTERVPQISLVSTDPISLLRDVTSTSGSGTINSTDDEYELNTSGSGDEATIESADYGQYVPGFSAQIGIGIRKIDLPSGSTIEWGGGDTNNNLLFRETSSDISVVLTRDGTEQFNVSQSNWNVDKLDGSGPSGIDFDARGGTTSGTVWQIDYTWYGYGVIVFSIVTNGPDRKQRVFPLHRERVDDKTSIRTPNLEIRATAKDGAKVAVGGRQYSNFGGSGINTLRAVSHERLSFSIASDATTGAIAVRRRSATWAERIRLVTDSNEVTCTQDSIVKAWIGASVTGGSWVDPSGIPNSDESAAEVNTSFTSFDTSNAVPISKNFVVAGQGSSSRGQSEKSTDPTTRPIIPRDEILILTIQTIGSNSATANAIVTWDETR